MPFPDVTRLVTVAMQDMTETVMIRVHAELINRHTGATCVFAGEERGTIRSTHRATGDGVAEIRTLRGELVNIRGVARGYRQRSHTTDSGVDQRKHRQGSAAELLGETFSNYTLRRNDVG